MLTFFMFVSFHHKHISGGEFPYQIRFLDTAFRKTLGSTFQHDSGRIAASPRKINFFACFGSSVRLFGFFT